MVKVGRKKSKRKGKSKRRGKGKKKKVVEKVKEEELDWVCLTIKLVPWETDLITGGLTALQCKWMIRTEQASLRSLWRRIKKLCGCCKKVEMYTCPPVEGNAIPEEWIFRGNKYLSDLGIVGGKRDENIQHTLFFDFDPGDTSEDPLMVTEPPLVLLDWAAEQDFEQYKHHFEDTHANSDSDHDEEYHSDESEHHEEEQGGSDGSHSHHSEDEESSDFDE